ncbi:MAG: alpha/beta fold hydrolase [Rhodospirillales bacterium]|nr:alpha/beta fold hydrolase [Rhodospirillales bacterium]
MLWPITDHVVKTARHTTFHLACGPADGPLLIFVHGWPELSLSWRHQLPAFAALGFRCIAPDIRGYGRSSIYPRHDDYALRPIVADMLELLDSTGREQAVWIGHDWGAPVVWSIAAHHAAHCIAVANLCVPYIAAGFALPNLVQLVDRARYPEAEFPAGQWEYMRFYEERFDEARAAFEADIPATVRALFRAGSPDQRTRPARTALVRRDGGWMGGMGRAPDLPRDPRVLTEADAAAYTAALTRTGFFGPGSWYRNHADNAAYAQEAPHGGRLEMPVLFLHARFDMTCDTTGSRLADPMRQDCADLTEATVGSGHWMAQEQPTAVNAALARWLATRTAAWPHVQ